MFLCLSKSLQIIPAPDFHHFYCEIENIPVPQFLCMCVCICICMHVNTYLILKTDTGSIYCHSVKLDSVLGAGGLSRNINTSKRITPYLLLRDSEGSGRVIVSQPSAQAYF